MSSPIAATAVALLVAVALAGAFLPAYMVVLPYLVMWLAYVPAGPVRAYNQVGDYSYGIYIYAFPVQQAVVALVPGISPAGVLAASLPIVAMLAVLSWHLIESPALGLLRRRTSETLTQAQAAP